MFQPMQGAEAQVCKSAPSANRGWYLRMSRSVSKSHYFVDGKSLCGRQFLTTKQRLEDFMHHTQHNCEVCMKRRDKIFGDSSC